MSQQDHIPLISVITVCYQAEAYLEQCMQSVLSQEFNDFEYIVIDGGSTDRSPDIIKGYAEKLAYWHSRPDRGLSHAFNIGMEKSRGKWIAFLNADDYYSGPRVLADAAEILVHADDADIVHGTIKYIAREDAASEVSEEVGKPWRWEDFRRSSTIPHPASFFSRHLYEEVGKFDETFRNALDYEFFLRKGSALRVTFIPRLFAYMRMGGMSTLDAKRSLRESRDAQVKNRAQGVMGAYAWWFYLRLRLFVKGLFVR
jgi:glycosyltransferase involved in cell wall biosynthesis